MKHYYPLALLLALASCHTAKPLQQQVPHETISRWQPAPPPATYLIPTTDSAQAPAYEAMPDSLPFVKVLRLKLPQIKSFKVFKPF